MTTVATARRVYRYWRRMGFSPADARLFVGAWLFAHHNHHQQGTAA